MQWVSYNLVMIKLVRGRVKWWKEELSLNCKLRRIQELVDLEVVIEVILVATAVNWGQERGANKVTIFKWMF